MERSSGQDSGLGVLLARSGRPNGAMSPWGQAGQPLPQGLHVHLPRFLYSDEVQIGPETVMTTLYTAKKYAVPALEAHCVEFLKKNLRADNAFMLLTQVCGRGRRRPR